MSLLRAAEPVKLLTSFFGKDVSLMTEALTLLSGRWGEVDFVSPLLPFDETDYYEKETGKDLVRRLVSFATPIPPDKLPEVKIWANGVEDRFAVEGRRRLNIDPGYLSASHLILATGKGFAHRPYLRNGVYADLTLIYREGGFKTLPWTYPDYASPKLMGLLIKIRAKYMEQLKTMRKQES
jgi:hypothetical protein